MKPNRLPFIRAAVITVLAAATTLAHDAPDAEPAKKQEGTEARLTTPPTQKATAATTTATARETRNAPAVIEPKVRVRNPLQLINPFAPAKYGEGIDRVVYDPITGEPRGVTLFGLRW